MCVPGSSRNVVEIAMPTQAQTIRVNSKKFAKLFGSSKQYMLGKQFGKLFAVFFGSAARKAGGNAAPLAAFPPRGDGLRHRLRGLPG